jgi:predicted transcriptional regulator
MLVTVQCGVRCVALSIVESTAVKTIQMTIDERLLKVVDKITRARKTTRSAFIREALEAEIRRQRIREDEVRHAEGYAHKPVAPREFDIWLSEQDWGTS